MNMQDIFGIDIQSMTGIPLDLVVIGMGILVIILIILMIIQGARTRGLKRRYEAFMEGDDSQSLEDQIQERLSELQELRDMEIANRKKLDAVIEQFGKTYQKIGLVKYDAFNEMGGNLSFTLCLLNRENTGFILNAMHSREGCYTYIKEIIQGNPVLFLGDEEKESLEMALRS